MSPPGLPSEAPPRTPLPNDSGSGSEVDKSKLFPFKETLRTITQNLKQSQSHAEPTCYGSSKLTWDEAKAILSSKFPKAPRQRVYQSDEIDTIPPWNQLPTTATPDHPGHSSGLLDPDATQNADSGAGLSALDGAPHSTTTSTSTAESLSTPTKIKSTSSHDSQQISLESLKRKITEDSKKLMNAESMFFDTTSPSDIDQSIGLVYSMLWIIYPDQMKTQFGVQSRKELEVRVPTVKKVVLKLLRSMTLPTATDQHIQDDEVLLSQMEEIVKKSLEGDGKLVQLVFETFSTTFGRRCDDTSTSSTADPDLSALKYWVCSSNGYMEKETFVGQGTSRVVTRRTNQDDVVWKRVAFDSEDALWDLSELEEVCQEREIEVTDEIRLVAIVEIFFYLLREIHITVQAGKGDGVVKHAGDFFLEVSSCRTTTSDGHDLLQLVPPVINADIDNADSDDEEEDQGEKILHINEVMLFRGNPAVEQFLEESLDVMVDNLKSSSLDVLSGSNKRFLSMKRFRVTTCLPLKRMLCSVEDFQKECGLEMEQAFGEEFRLYLIVSLARTLKRLHSSVDILSHNDIKLGNLMIDEHGLKAFLEICQRLSATPQNFDRTSTGVDAGGATMSHLTQGNNAGGDIIKRASSELMAMFKEEHGTDLSTGTTTSSADTADIRDAVANVIKITDFGAGNIHTLARTKVVIDTFEQTEILSPSALMTNETLKSARSKHERAEENDVEDLARVLFAMATNADHEVQQSDLRTMVHNSTTDEYHDPGSTGHVAFDHGDESSKPELIYNLSHTRFSTLSELEREIVKRCTPQELVVKSSSDNEVRHVVIARQKIKTFGDLLNFIESYKITNKLAEKANSSTSDHSNHSSDDHQYDNQHAADQHSATHDDVLQLARLTAGAPSAGGAVTSRESTNASMTSSSTMPLYDLFDQSGNHTPQGMEWQEDVDIAPVTISEVQFDTVNPDQLHVRGKSFSMKTDKAPSRAMELLFLELDGSYIMNDTTGHAGPVDPESEVKLKAAAAAAERKHWCKPLRTPRNFGLLTPAGSSNHVFGFEYQGRVTHITGF